MHGYAKNRYTEIDSRDPEFTEWELQRAAGSSGGNFLVTIMRLYEGRRLSAKSWTSSSDAVKKAVQVLAEEATLRLHAFVLVSPTGNLGTRVYLGREAAEAAASFSGGSHIVDLFGAPELGLNELGMAEHFLGLFPANEVLVNRLLRRWARQIRFTPNTPASRAAVIARGREALARAEAVEQMANLDRQPVPVN